MTGPRSWRRQGPFFPFFRLSAQQHPQSDRVYPRCAILQQGMHLNVFSKVYCDRVYFSCAERIMTGSGFDPPPPPPGTPYPVEKSSAPPPPPDGVDPFFGLGGGGAKCEKAQKRPTNFVALCGKYAAKMTIVYVKWYLKFECCTIVHFKPILALHIY